jgi:hypothetical protein
MLSVTPPHPAVADVSVGSTQWSSSFVSYLQSAGLGTGGYSIPVGSSLQLKTLPWSNVNQIRIKFSEDVVVQQNNLCVTGANQTQYAFSGFQYDANNFTAIWTLANPVGADKLMLDLDADGLHAVVSAADGSSLDGAWTDCSSTYNSGNGYGGADFQFRFNALPGDVNGSNGVNTSDLLTIRSLIGKNAGDAGYDVRDDIDGSGGITWDDYYAARGWMATLLPSGNPAGMSNDPPSTSGIANVSVNENAVDTVFSLLNSFADDEDSASALAYSIVGNTNPSLFSSASINSNDQLTLSFAQNGYGDSSLTVRATDTGGLYVETSFSVHVNAAPVISNFSGSPIGGDFWTFEGTVTDPDDNVQGMTVTFGGVLAGYNITTTVLSDGTFTFTQDLVGLQRGTATAQTQDPHGALSNLAEYWVVV